MKKILLIAITACFMLLTTKSEAKPTNATPTITTTTVSIDWGVLYTWNNTKYCSSFPWICRLTLSHDTRKASISFNNDSQELTIDFENSIISIEDYDKIFGGNELDFHSSDGDPFYTLPDDICEALGIAKGFQILSKKYIINKSNTGSTSITFK